MTRYVNRKRIAAVGLGEGTGARAKASTNFCQDCGAALSAPNAKRCHTCAFMDRKRKQQERMNRTNRLRRNDRRRDTISKLRQRWEFLKADKVSAIVLNPSEFNTLLRWAEAYIERVQEDASDSTQ